MGDFTASPLRRLSIFNMKNERTVFLPLTGLLSATAWADVTFRDVKTYTGFWGNGATTKLSFRIDVLTPEGVYYGEGTGWIYVVVGEYP